MRRLAQWSHDHRRRVYALWLVAVVAAAALAGVAGGSYSTDFHLKGAESQRALDLLKQRFPQQAGDSSQIVFRANTGTVRDPAQRAQVQRVVRSVQGLPSVVGVQSPFAGRGAISRDGRTAFATVAFDKTANELKKSDVQRVIDTARGGATSALQVNLGGQAIQQAQQSQQNATEVIGVLVAVVVLIFVLGSFGAMTLPLIVSFTAIIVATMLVKAASALVSIADFAPQLAIMIALGVGIDYALLVVSRFRGERARGADVREATVTAMDTAGRSVLFAGTTVVIALLGMLVLGLRFLNGPAIAAALAVLLTMIGSLTMLPALLGSWGHRIKPAKLADLDAEPRGWARLAHAVERRPAMFAVGAAVVLLLVASPALHMNLGFSDAGNDSPTKTTRIAYDQLSEGFGPGFNGPFLVVAELPKGGAAGQAALARLRSALAAERGVAAVTPARLNPAGDTATLELFPTSKPQAAATKRLLTHLRDDVVPPLARAEALRVSIGGATAMQVDLSAALSAKLPAFILVVVGLSLLLLAMVFRSILVPLKAGVLNVLSIGAAMGVITWVFQEGHLGSLIGVDTTGPIEAFFPVFLFAIVFGLSMDYEVFLVTRMHEEWGRTRDASFAVRHGLALTGRVVTAAAIIMISVFASFMLGDDRVIKLFGLGLASAVFFDAFVIRLFLVPSLMYLMGERAWWLPQAIDRRLPRLSIEGPDAAAEPS
ncbi:MAG TPA: MMPL family transporter [Solirubrobacteraceae bacterium]|nr:MMPL family transporter [Solirubrobacteraceae bacterium]